MKAIPLEQALLTPLGFQHDRHWMVVNSNGRCVTQREMPEMALIHTHLDDKALVLSLPDQCSVSIPLDRLEGEPIKSRVWKDDCECVDQGEEVSRWLTKALKSRVSIRLVRMAAGFTRPQSMAAMLGKKTSTEFADAAPFLVANQASLNELNSQLECDFIPNVPMNRFRPNIVVEGPLTFAEHQLDELTTQDYRLKLCVPCKRCIVTTINQDTAELSVDKQPFKTLQTINPTPDGNKRAPAFGEYATLIQGSGQVMSLGDQLKATIKPVNQ